MEKSVMPEITPIVACPPTGRDASTGARQAKRPLYRKVIQSVRELHYGKGLSL